MQTFSDIALEALTRALNAPSQLQTTALLSVALGESVVSMTVTSGADEALVIHLMADDRGDTTVVGNPPLDLRIDVANFLVYLAQTWAHAGVPVNGVRKAAGQVYA